MDSRVGPLAFRHNPDMCTALSKSMREKKSAVRSLCLCNSFVFLHSYRLRVLVSDCLYGLVVFRGRQGFDLG